MGATIVNPKYPPPELREPAPYGYIYAGFTVDPPARAPFVRRSATRDALLARITSSAGRLELLDEVVKATVYRAVLMPPTEGAPRFDVVLLVETTTPDAIEAVRASEPYRELDATQEVTARNVRRIGDVDKTRPGIFLFNHFRTADPAVGLDLWDHLAGWYTAQTGLDNSTVLRPIDGDPGWAFVNHARWDGGLARLFAHQFTKPSFFTYVRANLRANDTVAMPVLYKLA